MQTQQRQQGQGRCHGQRVRDQFADDDRRDAAQHAAQGQAGQCAADHEQRQAATGLREQVDRSVHRQRQAPAQQRGDEAGQQCQHHRVDRQTLESLQQHALPRAGAALAALGQHQRQRNHHQVFHEHVQRQRNAGHRRHGQQQNGVADEAAVRATAAHGHKAALQRAQPAQATRTAIEQRQHRQRADQVGEQVAEVQDVADAALRQRVEQHGRQRQVDHELAKHAHVGARKQTQAGGQKADGDDQVDRQCDGEDGEHGRGGWGVAVAQLQAWRRIIVVAPSPSLAAGSVPAQGMAMPAC